MSTKKISSNFTSWVLISQTTKHAELGRGSRHGVENRALLVAGRVADVDLEHETVELRFGELICAFLLNGILRREYKERIGQRIRCIADRDLPLLHASRKVHSPLWRERG